MQVASRHAQLYVQVSELISCCCCGTSGLQELFGTVGAIKESYIHYDKK
jgi:hypothetical protein